jgi:ribosomal protein L40E
VSPQTPKQNDLLPRRRWRRILERAWYILLIVVGLVIVFVAAVSIAGVSPSFCGLCHVGDSQALDRSAHAGIHCDICHTASGVGGVAESRLALVQMTIDQALPGDAVTPAYVESERCLVCHEPQLEEVSVSNGIRMSHAELIADSWSCTRCHPASAHGTESLRQVGYNMDMCLQCHSTNPENPATCRTCHPEGPPQVAAAEGGDGTVVPTPAASPYSTPWQATHGADIKRTHGMGDLTTCKACHSAEQCLACHNTEMPHPSNFMLEHGVASLDAEEADCLQCHRQSLCDDCHQVDMPHGEGYLEEHSVEVRDRGDQVCVRCHTEESCLDCHLLHTHPGIPSDVLEQLRGRPVS